MKNKMTIGLAVFILLVFGVYTITFQVGFNESAVVSTFGKAGEDSVVNAGPDQSGAGLHWKLPYPIQQIQRYDKRVQVTEDRLEELQTRDKMGVIVNTYVAWRIARPLEFYRSMRTVEKAEQQIHSRMRDARSVIGNFTFDDLTNTDPERLKLREVEQAILTKLQQDMAREGQQATGIEFEGVGIKRIILPEPVTDKVFETMRKTRERLAQRARSAGDGEAKAIEARAKSARDRILAFAKRRAEVIRAEGDQAATRYYDVFNKAPEFATFLRNMEMYEQILGNKTTFLLDSKESQWQGFTKPLESVTRPAQ